MDLYYIDFISVNTRSWLHRLPAAVKMLALLLLIGTLITLELVPLDALLLLGVVMVAVTAHVPMKLFLALSLYPVVFLILLYLSIGDLTLAAGLLLALRILTINAAVVTFLLSTSYPAIFGTLSRVLPGFLVAALFFSYRSLFVISSSINDIRTALHLRGGLSWRHPARSLRHLGMALGHVLVHSIDASERMADGLMVRGFKNRIYYLGTRYER